MKEENPLTELLSHGPGGEHFVSKPAKNLEAGGVSGGVLPRCEKQPPVLPGGGIGGNGKTGLKEIGYGAEPP